MEPHVVIQLVGALAVLVPFVLLQFGVLSERSLPYLVLNLLGSGTLTVDAFLGRQWGFVLLQGVWALAAAWGLIRLARATRRGGRKARPA